MTATTPGRAVDAGTVQALQLAYGQLVRAGNDSVRAAWRFGQTIDSFQDGYTMRQLAQAMGRSVGTLNRYHRLFAAYQRPELAVQASEVLQTYNIDLVWGLQNQMMPVEHRTTLGRRYRYRCHHCQSLEVQREEITDPTELAELDSQAKAAAGAN
jgi:hypothetical protein